MSKAVEKELTLEKKVENVDMEAVKDFQYKREDCESGYITDPREIEDYKRNQQIDLLQNALLGDYDSTGKYYLQDEIIDELTKIPKVVTGNYENFIFVQSIVPIGNFGVVKFFITVSKLDDGLIATLTLVEPIHKMNKLMTNAQSALVASFVGKGGDKFFLDMKQEFHIVDDDFVMPDDKKDVFKYSLRRKMQRRSIWLESLKGIERTEKEIFEKKIEVLKNMKNDFSKEVLGNLNMQLKGKSQYFSGHKNEYVCLNQLLDSCINATLGKFPEQQAIFYDALYDLTKDAILEQAKVIDIAKDTIARNQDKTSGATKIMPREQQTPENNATHESQSHSLGTFITGNNKDALDNTEEKAKGATTEKGGNFSTGNMPKPPAPKSEKIGKNFDGMSM